MRDKFTVLNVIGCLLKRPTLLKENNISTEDFPERFHKVIFGAINNLVKNGLLDLDILDIDNFLSSYPKQFKVFTDNDGITFLENCRNLSDISKFDYYYTRLKKFSLLNQMKQKGINVSDIYDEDIIDIPLMQKQQKDFDEMTINDILGLLEVKLIELKQDFQTDENIEEFHAGSGLRELKESYKEEPEMGAPMGSAILTTIVRGARLKKFYLKSSPTGIGKTRVAVEDACTIGVGQYYDWNLKKWVNTGISEPTLYIATEQEKDEMQALIIAWVSGVEEEKVISGSYTAKEEKIIDEAILRIESSNLHFSIVPSFTVETIEAQIRKHKVKYDIGYAFFDYIFLSVEMLQEISSKSRGVKVGEHSVLYMFSDAMKKLANKLNIHISSSTQTNDTWEGKRDANQNMIRGSKAIADKIDFGAIMLRPTEEDLESLQPVIAKLKGFNPVPNIVYHIYKVRRGKLNLIKLWVYFDHGTCRTTDLFVTTNDYKLIKVDATTVEKILEDTEVEDKKSSSELTGKSPVIESIF